LDGTVNRGIPLLMIDGIQHNPCHDRWFRFTKSRVYRNRMEAT
jgi:hypothetical protein